MNQKCALEEWVAKFWFLSKKKSVRQKKKWNKGREYLNSEKWDNILIMSCLEF